MQCGTTKLAAIYCHHMWSMKKKWSNTAIIITLQCGYKCKNLSSEQTKIWWTWYDEEDKESLSSRASFLLSILQFTRFTYRMQRPLWVDPTSAVRREWLDLQLWTFLLCKLLLLPAEILQNPTDSAQSLSSYISEKKKRRPALSSFLIARSAPDTETVHMRSSSQALLSVNTPQRLWWAREGALAPSPSGRVTSLCLCAGRQQCLVYGLALRTTNLLTLRLIDIDNIKPCAHQRFLTWKEASKNCDASL